ncbi:MAG: glycosyltransferase family 39 protein [Alphaproteobacteria bacterium]|nr:MAG: glycosyltransferase family 39 protein [Alphaproteobacteria bacterium]
MIARLAPQSITRDIGVLFGFATAAHARAVAFLILISLAAFLPGFFNIPPVDRDEARFAQATKQMIESGDYIDIRFQDEVRYKKPVGIYWLQAGVVRAAEAIGVPQAHTTIWLYRVPSLIGAIGAVLLTYWAALAFVTARGAFLAALMMATCALLNVEARLAKTDAMLLLCCVAAMGVMARAYLTQSAGRDIPWSHALILWTALAAGVLLKGPLILMVVGLAALAVSIADRSARWVLRLRPLVGILWILLLVLPWFVAIMGRAGESFLEESVGQDLLAKIFRGQETHGAPPGYYLLLFWVTFWPAAPLAAVAAPAVWRYRREPALRFLLAWLVPCWIVFELVVTKLPHYVLPLYPAIAILIAREIERRQLSVNPHLTRFTVLWPILAAVIPAAAVWLVVYMRGQFAWLAWPFGAAGLIFGFYAWRLYDVEGAERSLLRACLASILMTFAVLGVAVPLMRPIFPSLALIDLVRNDDCRNPLIAAAGYHEPSLVFLLGTRTRLVDGSTAAEVLRGGECRYAIVESRQDRAFAQRAELLGLRYTLRGRLENSFNFNGGRAISFAIYRTEPQR